MSELRQQIKAFFEDDPVPPGLREEILAEVDAKRHSSSQQFGWVAAVAVLVAVLVITGLLLTRASLLSGAPAGPPRGAPRVTNPVVQPTGIPSPAPSASAAPPPASGPAPVPAGPYTTLAAAEAFVRSQPAFSTLRPDFTDTNRVWRPSAALHVVHATPAGGADYGGDYYYFLVNGNLVGQRFFAKATSDTPLDDVTFTVTYAVYQPGDPHCCPTGGTRTARFRWNGTSLTAPAS
jgi:LppP/LprE lipoprotein